MKTKRTDLTPEEIEAAEKAGISTLTPAEQDELRWQQSSKLGKVIGLEDFIGLCIALVIAWWLVSVFRSANKDDGDKGNKKEGGNES